MKKKKQITLTIREVITALRNTAENIDRLSTVDVAARCELYADELELNETETRLTSTH